MADQPVEQDSAARVALDMANRIWTWEHSGKGFPSDARKPFLDLYAECLYAARGYRDRPK